MGVARLQKRRERRGWEANKNALCRLYNLIGAACFSAARTNAIGCNPSRAAELALTCTKALAFLLVTRESERAAEEASYFSKCAYYYVYILMPH